ncbi:STAS domain-containing protein [Colwellia sp. MEBiC06753]
MFKLPSELTIAKAQEFKQLLMDYVADCDSIEIDDSDVDKIDTIGVQLLLSMTHHFVTCNKDVTWHIHSSMIRESILKLGINDAILTQYLEPQS